MRVANATATSSQSRDSNADRRGELDDRGGSAACAADELGREGVGGGGGGLDAAAGNARSGGGDRRSAEAEVGGNAVGRDCGRAEQNDGGGGAAAPADPPHRSQPHTPTFSPPSHPLFLFPTYTSPLSDSPLSDSPLPASPSPTSTSHSPLQRCCPCQRGTAATHINILPPFPPTAIPTLHGVLHLPSSAAVHVSVGSQPVRCPHPPPLPPLFPPPSSFMTSPLPIHQRCWPRQRGIAASSPPTRRRERFNLGRRKVREKGGKGRVRG
ncbi:unnamed protein product [Closterium sp. NIES-53]